MSTLKVMTFNIHGSYNWERRVPLNVAVIKRAAPDLIGFQELQQENLIVYQEQLSAYKYLLGPIAADDEPYKCNAIFWQPSRLTSIDSGSYWLSETPETPSYGWGAKTRRSAQWARFLSVDTGRELFHLNTHLDHIREQARVEGISLILQRLAQLQSDTIPVILTGDFNSNPDTAAYRLLQEGGFQDLYRLAGHRDREYSWTSNEADSAYSNTAHAYGWTKPSSSGAKGMGPVRIDWVLLRDSVGQLRPLTCEILRDAQPPLYPSDHYPVLATLEQI